MVYIYIYLVYEDKRILPTPAASNFLRANTLSRSFGGGNRAVCLLFAAFFREQLKQLKALYMVARC